MASQPDTNPNSLPPEMPPPTVPGEVQPDGGDIDNPGQTPSESPGAPSVNTPIE